MFMRRVILGAAAVLALTAPSSAKAVTQGDRLRAEARRLCYPDAKALCAGALPDEAKVGACLKAKRAKLSSGCRKVVDRGANR